MTHRVIATDAALELIDFLKKKHGPLMFHQSGGCCDGSSPMCYPDGELIIGDQDILLGHIGERRSICTKTNSSIGSIHSSLLTLSMVAGECFRSKVSKANAF